MSEPRPKESGAPGWKLPRRPGHAGGELWYYKTYVKGGAVDVYVHTVPGVMCNFRLTRTMLRTLLRAAGEPR